MKELLEIKMNIERSWSIYTTYCPQHWYRGNPAFEQCGVSSLLLYNILKNSEYTCKIFKCNVNKVLHYFNTVNDIPFDLTWSQFIAGSEITDIQECAEDELINAEWKIELYNEIANNYKQLKKAV